MFANGTHGHPGDIPAAILAGGMATRLYPITHKIPKALVQVAGRPFVDHQLSLLAQKGLRKVVFCVGNLGEQIEAHVGDGRQYGLEVRYSHDGPRLLGTGGALRRALPLLGEAFWVIYGDSYMDVDYQGIHEHYDTAKKPALMTVLRNENCWDTSNVVFQDGWLVCYSKKSRRPEMTHIDYGIAILQRAVVERIDPERGGDLADLYSELVAEGRMIGHEVTQRFYEIGSPAGLAETEAHLLARSA
jgi:NDP-sugar pyrophosphorylase family protein